MQKFPDVPCHAMNTQGPSNNWELETRRILQQQLPEYDVDPHMRLANVVQGRVRVVRAMSQYEIDFTVRDKETGAVVCAIELDGPTHDTDDGRRRDANKNKWLAQAGIKLIRIRHPDEANNIRSLIENQQVEEMVEPHWSESTFSKSGKSGRFLTYIAMTAMSMFVVWFGFAMVENYIQKRTAEITQKAQQRAAQQHAETRPGTQAVQQPTYERVLVRGRSARECARPDGTLDNYTVRCMSDHYEMVQVNGPR